MNEGVNCCPGWKKKAKRKTNQRKKKQGEALRVHINVIPNSKHPNANKITSQNQIDEILWQELEDKKEAEENSAPNQREAHGVLFRHLFLKKKSLSVVNQSAILGSTW